MAKFLFHKKKAFSQVNTYRGNNVQVLSLILYIALPCSMLNRREKKPLNIAHEKSSSTQWVLPKAESREGEKEGRPILSSQGSRDRRESHPRQCLGGLKIRHTHEKSIFLITTIIYFYIHMGGGDGVCVCAGEFGVKKGLSLS